MNFSKKCLASSGHYKYGWARQSWQDFPVAQEPKWPDSVARDEARAKLAYLPALVFAGETRALKRQLADAAKGKAFVLQAGDCAETFARCHGPYIHDLLKVILQMSVILAYSGERKIVNIGRLAGQYAKPRSQATEIVDGRELPIYRGDMINGYEPTMAARTPDPCRMLEGYFCSASTLNLLRAFTTGGYASLSYVNSWNEASFGQFHSNPDYKALCADIQKAVNFMSAIGFDSSAPQMSQASMYTSHEALLLEYEEALTRMDTTTGDWYDTSAHMIWIGNRTRQIDGAHVEFCRGVCNPIGVKIGPDYNIDDLKRLVDKLNPDNEAGRLSLITRFGASGVIGFLPPILEAIICEGWNVVCICDPMHGNTYTDKNGKKTRNFADILAEVRAFFSAHSALGVPPGGIHLELSGNNITECVGGDCSFTGNDLDVNYQTVCDPRLSAAQAVELAFEVARMLKPE